jgi:hypothetical protein
MFLSDSIDIALDFLSSYRDCQLTIDIFQQWDILLESFVDWLSLAFRGYQSRVSQKDYQRILDCLPHSHAATGLYKSNLDRLFWNGGEPYQSGRAADFLPGLPATAFADAYDIILTSPPDKEWNLVKIMREVRKRGKFVPHIPA